jgi:hypothetical protein
MLIGYPNLSLIDFYLFILQAVRKAIIAGSFANSCHLEVFTQILHYRADFMLSYISSM